MASGRNEAPHPTDAAPVAGLGARLVAQAAVSALLGASRGLALDDALVQAARITPVEPGQAALARAIATTSFRRLGYLREAHFAVVALARPLARDLRRHPARSPCLRGRNGFPRATFPCEGRRSGASPSMRRMEPSCRRTPRA